MNYHVNMNGIDVDAYYDDNTIKYIFFPLLERVTALQKEKNRRILVFIAAPPGAGKSTLCSFLQKLSEDNEQFTDAQAIGMDGFHRRQEYLTSHTTVRGGREIKMVEIKGAPITFDLELFTHKIKEVLSKEKVGWPVYDRMLHNPVDDAVTVTKDIVFLEGNYLLLNDDGWKDLKELADLTIFISADEKMLRGRLIERKAASGNDIETATRFVDYSDIPNVRLCLNNSQKADITLILDEQGDYHFDKSTLRKLIVAKRDKLTAKERIEKSSQIFEKLIETPEYKRAENVLVYASMGSEVITDDIILDALSEGKNVFCPKVISRKEREMKFVQISRIEDLEEGFQGIREPVITDSSVIFNMDSDLYDYDQMKNTLVIMPGTVFDKKRNRIGYNGGFYDTFLSVFHGLSTFALAYDVQIFEGDILAKDHDIKPDKIITDIQNLQKQF